ncbi:ogr/Delta-like zinc finger family protein [Burkholderia diffusa]|uniref:ogr/Delta-like zinc finger family protein n=1 Tax=Burkholderia diffusa TaxID=488732 RepID=UPI0015892DB0|nr:ogr/Delta-like zinc finger family protein [Burkholderia diffusa]
MSGMKIGCPCCTGEIEARHTEAMSVTMRRLYFVCDDCGFRSPPARPRDGVALAVCPSDRLRGAVDSRTTLSVLEVGA